MAEVKFFNAPHEQPLIYVNAWGQKVTSAEVILEFGDVISEDGETQVARSSAKMVMTHSSFLKMAAQFARMSEFMTDVYGGQMPAAPEQITEEKAAELNTKYGDIFAIGLK